VERLQANLDFGISYTYFPLHPDTPADGLTLEELFAGRGIDVPASQERIRQLMADEGLPFGRRSMTYNSRLAQELGKWADTQPGGSKIHDALYKAYFVDNCNLASVSILLQVVADLGLPVDEAEKVLAERKFAKDVDADWRRAQTIGISAVPTFVVGNRGLAGAQPYEQMERFLLDAGVQRR